MRGEYPNFGKDKKGRPSLNMRRILGVATPRITENCRPTVDNMSKSFPTVSIAFDEGTKRVELSEKYRKFLPKKEFIVEEDLLFFERLLDKYGLSETKNSTGGAIKKFGEVEFYEAASDIINYAFQLRSDKMPDRNVVSPNKKTFQDKVGNILYEMMDKMQLSSQRTKDLCTLFLHHPKIKSVYLNTHLRKMEQALPDFVTKMSSLKETSEEINSRSEYLKGVTHLMEESMKNATHIFSPDQVNALGIVIGYQEKGMLLHQSERKRMFAEIGVETFTSFLGTIIEDAIANGQEISSAVKRELLEKDGTGFILMRTNLSEVSSLVKNVRRHNTLEEARESLIEDVSSSGTCPAIFKTASLDDSKNQRPIVYEYASVIINNMPKNLRSSST